MNAQVSVIIPALNSRTISRTLDALLAQRELPRICEILVIGKDEPRLVHEVGPIHFIDTGRPVTAPVARNIGMEQARGNILAFVDSDCVPEVDWLRQLLLVQADGHPVVGGSVAFPPRPYWQLCYNLTMFHEFLVTTPMGYRANMGSLNLCVTRDVVERVGLMDERLDRGQDTEWTLRMRRNGYELFFVPSAVVMHLPEVHNLRRILKTWYRSGTFNAWIRSEYSELIAPPPLNGHPVLQRALSPAVALAVTMRVFARDLRLLRYAHTFPVLFATKVAWCLGASRPFEPTSV